jgi:hypothetical protein
VDLIPNPEDGVLRALERSRSLVLEEAQSLRNARAHELATREAAYSAIVSEREHAYELQRRQVGRMIVFSSEQLHWTRLEEVRVVERLRARRMEEFLQARNRRQQWRLDELGVIRAWNVGSLTTGEDTWLSPE